MPELRANDLCLVDVGGQYEFAVVGQRSASGHVLLQTISGGIVGGPVALLTIIKPTGAEAGYADALDWAAELVDDCNS